jgi:hypothetical protein
MTTPTYDTDFYAWTRQQAAALAAKDWSALDLDHLVEEIERLGSEQEHAVESHLRILLAHLLKWVYQPQRRRRRWQTSVLNAHTEITRRLERNPSLQHAWPEMLAWAYPKARQLAATETGLPRATFPEACPWTWRRCWMRTGGRRGEREKPWDTAMLSCGGCPWMSWSKPMTRKRRAWVSQWTCVAKKSPGVRWKRRANACWL